MNKKILTLLAIGATLGGVLSAPTSTVFASRTKSVKVTKKHKRVKKAKKAKRIIYKVVPGTKSIKVRVTSNVPIYQYTTKGKYGRKNTLKKGEILSIKPGTHNTWIATSAEYNWKDLGLIYVIKKHNGWYSTDLDPNRAKVEEARRKFNSSLENQVGSKEYNAMRNRLNDDRNDIRNWVERN